MYTCVKEFRHLLLLKNMDYQNGGCLLCHNKSKDSFKAAPHNHADYRSAKERYPLTSGMKHLDKLAIIVKLEHVSNSYMLKIMFEENGILYADSSKELLKIQDAKPLMT